MDTRSAPSADTLTKLAFFDELVKISVSQEGAANRAKAKGWAKNTLALAAGAGAATGAYMLGERAVAGMFGKKWGSLSRNAQVAILGPAAGAATLGAAALVNKLMQEKKRRGS